MKRHSRQLKLIKEGGGAREGEREEGYGKGPKVRLNNYYCVLETKQQILPLEETTVTNKSWFQCRERRIIAINFKAVTRMNVCMP